MSKVSIIGAYNTKFGAFIEKNKETGEIKDTKTIYDLLIEAGRGALEDAGIEAKDIDAVYVGSCSPDAFANQNHIATVAADIHPDLRLKPMTRTEDACASSSVAIYDATYAIESGRFKNILVIGVEKMNLLNTKDMTHTLACCSYFPEEGAKGMTFPGLFAEIAKIYRDHYKLDNTEFRKMLTTVGALCYKNGFENPLAHFGPDSFMAKLQLFSADKIMSMPDEGKGSNLMIADPLRLHDCSLVSDGAAAVVLSATDHAKAMKKTRIVEIAGIGHSAEYLALSKRPSPWTLDAGKDAVRKAFTEAKITINDVDMVEVHDCFTINQILTTEALGLSKEGRGGYDYMEGRFTRDDKCAVNLSGGLKSKGHPVGATGASMHALIFKQLVGEAIGVKAKKADIGVTFNVGGSAVTNAVTVLRRLK